MIAPLYLEIDHIHLSSEAQCVSHHLPQVDCHNTPVTLIHLGQETRTTSGLPLVTRDTDSYETTVIYLCVAGTCLCECHIRLIGFIYIVLI